MSASNSVQARHPSILCLLGAGREEGEKGGGPAHTKHIVDQRRGRAQHIETADNDKREEEGVVVEDRKGRRLVVGNLILFPQHALVLLLLAHFLVVGEFLEHLLADGLLALHGNLVFEQELDILVGQRHQIRAEKRDDNEHADRDLVMRVQLVDSPEEPHRDGGHDQSVAIEESAGLGRHVATEVLEQELLFPRQFTGRRHTNLFTITIQLLNYLILV